MTQESSQNVTQILAQISQGDHRSASVLFELIYGELRRLAHQQMAHEPAGHTLQPTALVHEAYLRLVGNKDAHWQNRAHFFAAAARAMRQILIERARRRSRIKHGGQHRRISLDHLDKLVDTPSFDLLALDEALNRLQDLDPRKCEVVMLRYFAGLTIEQTAEALSVSPATVKSDWSYARAWLHRELELEEQR